MSKKTLSQYAKEIEQLEAKLDKVKSKLSSNPNVIGVSVGIKATSGLATETVCYIVEVEKKKTLANLKSEEYIPEQIEGFPTDVYERPILTAEGEVLCGGFGAYASGQGTLGAFALATAANTHLSADTPVILTNHHVAKSIGDYIGVGSVCNCWCCQCCDIGRVVDSQLTATVDGAIASLSEGTRYSHEILGIGAIRGSIAPAVGMDVVKYGLTTKLTHGRIMSITYGFKRSSDNHTFSATQLRVSPIAPSTDMSEGGDSGSVYVKADTREIVGLHHSGTANGPDAFGNRITDVMSTLNIYFPVMGTAGAIPLSSNIDIEYLPTLQDNLQKVEAEIRKTETGNYLINLVEKHFQEGRDLVNYNREAKVVWQRFKGPAFLAHFLKSARDPSHIIPIEIEGLRVENLILAMAEVFQDQGSESFSETIREHYLTVLKLISNCESVEILIDRVKKYTNQPQDN